MIKQPFSSRPPWESDRMRKSELGGETDTLIKEVREPNKMASRHVDDDRHLDQRGSRVKLQQGARWGDYHLKGLTFTDTERDSTLLQYRRFRVTTITWTQISGQSYMSINRKTFNCNELFQFNLVVMCCCTGKSSGFMPDCKSDFQVNCRRLIIIS